MCWGKHGVVGYTELDLKVQVRIPPLLLGQLPENTQTRAGSSRWPKLQSVLPAWDAEMGLLAAGPGLAVVDIRKSKLTEGLSLSVILLFQISNIFLFKGF